jgi:isopentenyl diphosphate isomerase/L-lactate dehydrogenase-like FMN-dependent dehydrogenase
MEETLGRVKRAGFNALCLTVDLAFYGHRERQMMNNWLPPSNPNDPSRIYQMSMTWDTVDAIREIWDLPFILKGVATPEDAGLAVEHGVDLIYVSNHGGRALDHAMATIDMLEEVVAAVGGKRDVLVDGGIVRGSDVIKALCLGAKAVGIGKLQGWALAAGGEMGLVRALEMLEAEIKGTMALLGVTDLGQLGPEYVRKATPVVHTNELSAFVHLPNDLKTSIA